MLRIFLFCFCLHWSRCTRGDCDFWNNKKMFSFFFLVDQLYGELLRDDWWTGEGQQLCDLLQNPFFLFFSRSAVRKERFFFTWVTTPVGGQCATVRVVKTAMSK